MPHLEDVRHVYLEELAAAGRVLRAEHRAYECAKTSCFPHLILIYMENPL
jgi:hypothetical protein